MEYLQLENLLQFTLYFLGALLALVIFKFAYSLVTPHDEWALIKEQKSTAAAIGFGGAILGFAIALSGSISNSVTFTDFALWAVVALVAQTLAFALVRFMFMPQIVRRIEEGEVSAGIMLAAVNVSVGLLNAACMTY